VKRTLSHLLKIVSFDIDIGLISIMLDANFNHPMQIGYNVVTSKI
jgi:hypothetical protein